MENKMKYRKKPVVIEAIQFFNGDGKGNTIRECLEFCKMNKTPMGYDDFTGRLIIRTLEGVMVASDGDYIIKGISGEFYPCKPDIFDLTYEKVEDDKYTESEKREINLEAIIHAMYEVFEKLDNILTPPAASGIMTELYNTAGIRSNIADCVNIKIEFEDEE